MNVDVTGSACGANAVVEPPKRKTPSRDYIGGCVQVMLYCPADQSDRSKSHPEAQNMSWYSPASGGNYEGAAGVYRGKQ